MEGHFVDREGLLFDWRGHLYYEKGHNFVTNDWGAKF